MTFNYFKSKEVSHLVDNYFELEFDNTDLPFESTILPTAQTHLVFIYPHTQKVIIKNNAFLINGLTLFGQSFRAYKLEVNQPGFSFGVNLHPTTLHKILGIDISIYQDKHISLDAINKQLFDILSPVLKENSSSESKINEIEKILINLPLKKDKNIEYIDKAVNLIRSKEGLLSVESLLESIPVSQKTLETQFKLIVGLTPGKYIKLLRFLCLMKKFETQELELKDVIQMYDYYDRSHFTKDFKLFMNNTIQNYLYENNDLLLKTYLKRNDYDFLQ